MARRAATPACLNPRATGPAASLFVCFGLSEARPWNGQYVGSLGLGWTGRSKQRRTSKPLIVPEEFCRYPGVKPAKLQTRAASPSRSSAATPNACTDLTAGDSAIGLHVFPTPLTDRVCSVASISSFIPGTDLPGVLVRAGEGELRLTVGWIRSCSSGGRRGSSCVSCPDTRRGGSDPTGCNCRSASRWPKLGRKN